MDPFTFFLWVVGIVGATLTVYALVFIVFVAWFGFVAARAISRNHGFFH